MMFKKNVGKTDSMVRIVLGILLLLATVLPKTIIGLLGLGVIATGIIGYCGLYNIFGANTCELENKSNHGDMQK